MFTIKPIDITAGGLLTTSNVTEADETEFDTAGYPYADGDVVMVTTTANGASAATHRIYTSTAASNNEDPTLRTTYVSGSDTVLWWTDNGSTNRYKMFDNVVQSQTVRTGGIEVVITPARYTNSLALINVSGATVDVVMDSTADGEVYNESYSLTSYSGIADWYAYYFTPIERVSELVINDMPQYADATVTVTVNDTGDAAVGELVIGTMFTIGDSLHGANLGIIDYTVKNTSATGEITVTPGAYAKRSQVDVLCLTARTPEINTYLAAIRSTPVVWVADPENGATIIYGYYREFNTILSDHFSSTCNLQIEGLT